ncbi:MAG: PKD domain-containing protein, partial [Magnetococcus sp. WYHC-3]
MWPNVLRLIETGEYLYSGPDNGVLAENGAVDVTVTFDTTKLVPGVHRSELRIASNDPDRPEAVIPVTFTVTGENQAPAAVSKTVTVARDRTRVRIDLDATDPEGAPLTYTIASKPAHGTLWTGFYATAPDLEWLNKGEAFVSYTPSAGYVGTDAFTFKVSDGQKESTGTITIQVKADADADFVAWLKLDEAAGSAAADSSTYGWGGQAEGGPARIPGVVGNAMRFDGVDDAVTIEDRENLTTPCGLTVACWVRRDSSSGAGSFVNKGELYDLGVDSSGKLCGSIKHLWSWWTMAKFNSGVTIPTGRWTHVAMTVNPTGGIARLYLDGAQVSKHSFTYTKYGVVELLATSYSPVRLAAQRPLRGEIWQLKNFLRVDLDEVRIYGRPVSAAEVAAMAQVSGNRPPTVTASGTPTSGAAPLAVNFTATGADVDGDTLTYAWTFGDSGTSTAQNPSHVYASAGNYTATVTVSDGKGGTASATVVITVTSSGGGGEQVWVEDAIPSGGTAASTGADSWTWVSANPAPYSGSQAHQSAIASGAHQHYFYNATATLGVNSGDRLFAYIYLDPANVPSEVMLQWNDGSWEHRAYWGANSLPWGVDGTVSRRYIGPLPAAGQWVRLEVAASLVGLEGRTLNGMAFTLYGGKATWDRAGRAYGTATNQPPAANAQSVSTAEDTVKAITLTGSDPEGSNLVYTVVTQPAHGTLTGTGASRTYTPAANYNGADSFTFVVSDGALDSAAATVSITVTPVNDAPTVTVGGTPTSGTAPLAVNFTATGADVDGDTLTYSWIFGDGATGTGASISHTYTSPGSYTSQVTVSDGKGGSASKSVTITVTAAGGTVGIVNGSFETPSVGSGYVSNPAGATWTITGAIAGNGSAWGNPAAPDGVQVCCIQIGSYASQNVNFASGAYRIVFSGAQRKGQQQTVQVSLDGISLGNFKAAGTAFESFTTATVTPGAGVHALKFQGLNLSGDNTMFIDNVRLVAVSNQSPVAMAGVNPTTGATTNEFYFWATESYDPDGTIASNRWQINSALVSTNAEFLWTFATAGTYTVTLTVWDNQGASDSDAVVVNVSASVLPVVSLTVSDAVAGEPGLVEGTGKFTVSRSGDLTKAITVKYAMSGTASNGVDYTKLSGSVNLAAGKASVSVTLTPLADALVEG